VDEKGSAIFRKEESKMKGTKIRVLFYLLTTVFLTIGMSSQGFGVELARVRWGTIPVISATGIFIAMDKGYFQSEGIEVEIVTIPKSDVRLKALLSGDVNVILGGFGADIINAIQEGAPVRIVADTGQVREKYPYVVWLVRKDLWDSGKVRGYKDFKGLRVAFGDQQGSINDFFMRKALSTVGLKADDVIFKLVDWPLIPNAMANKAIDVAQSLEPFTIAAVNMGSAVVLGPVSDVMSDRASQQVVITMNTRFMSERPDHAKAFIRGMLRGVRDYNLALTQGTGKEEMFTILEKRTKLSRDLLSRMGFPYIDPNLRLNEKATLEQLQFFYDTGVIKKPVKKIEEIVNYQFSPPTK
jgi:ABC-type nitrate/sulfonate/bicarbonate transport system substrate-binding protein